MVLSPRHSEILRLVVEVFVSTGEPVSSKVVAEQQRGRPLSAATIRNELTMLCDLGLVDRPHPRSGCVPTDKGLRAYLDGSMSPKLHPWDRTHLDAAALAQPSELPAKLGQALSAITGEMVVVGVPRFVGTTFREVGLVRCNPGQLLAYFVSPGGQVQQKLVEVDFDLGPDELLRVQNFLNDRLTHRTLREVRDTVREELASEEARRDRLRRAALEIGVRALPDPETVLTVEGAAQLARKPELAGSERLQDLLRAIETKHALLRLLDSIIDDQGVTVVLGSEHHVSEISDLACVGGSCPSAGGTRPATIGVIGPARMDYGRVVPLVGYAKALFERYWRSY